MENASEAKTEADQYHQRHQALLLYCYSETNTNHKNFLATVYHEWDMNVNLYYLAKIEIIILEPRDFQNKYIWGQGL